MCLSFDPALKCVENQDVGPLRGRWELGQGGRKLVATVCNWQLISWVLFYCWARMIKITPVGRSPKAQALCVAGPSEYGRQDVGWLLPQGLALGTNREECPVGP